MTVLFKISIKYKVIVDIKSVNIATLIHNNVIDTSVYRRRFTSKLLVIIKK